MGIAEQLLSTIPNTQITNMQPSAWVENNITLGTGLTSFPGKFKYDRTPYTRELIDCMSPDHPAKIIAIMKGSQIGVSMGFVLPAICYLIANHPGNIIFTAGDDELVKKAVEQKLDILIDSSGISSLIRPMTRRTRRSADTTNLKEFAGGVFHAKSIQSTGWVRQESYKYGFLDDYEMASLVNESREGDILDTIIERFKWYLNSMKLALISTPATEGTSKIKRAYLQGDQRKFFMPCPRCHEMITFEFYKKNENGDRYGVIFEKDSQGKVVKDSVGYVCKECGSFFDEKHKKSMMSQGQWIPTAEPKTDGFYSYHISGLYAPPGTETWAKICEKFVKCFDADGRGIARKLQTFNNLILGETFKEKVKNTSISKIASNTRSYQSGTVPSKLSEQDGNGKIILLTCACDINGTEEDARLDWEVLGHSENESTYSIDHGSIGTYDNTKKQKEDREKLTYRLQSEDSVWHRFTEIWQREYTSDQGKKMRVMLTGVDSGYLKKYAYEYCDKHQGKVVPLKGQDDMKARRLDLDTMPFKQGQERDDLYMIQGNQIKDYLADMMQLTWESGVDQPSGFMNFPYPSPNKYTIDSYFVEYQGEERRAELNADGSAIAYRWEKKHNSVRNHFWDCRLYNLALKHIFIKRLFDSEALKKHRPGTWQKYVRIVGS